MKKRAATRMRGLRVYEDYKDRKTTLLALWNVRHVVICKAGRDATAQEISCLIFAKAPCHRNPIKALRAKSQNNLIQAFLALVSRLACLIARKMFGQRDFLRAAPSLYVRSPRTRVAVCFLAFICYATAQLRSS